MHSLLVIIVLALCGQLSESPDVGFDDPNVVAVVAGASVQLDSFRDYYIDHLLKTGESDTPRLRRCYLDRYVRRLLVIERARDAEVVNAEYLHEQRRIEQKLLIEGYLHSEVYPAYPVTEQDLREMFVRINTTLKVRHLYAPTVDSARALLARLHAGESFENLARDVFQDPELATTGGDLGHIEFDEMDPAFEDAAFRLDPGEISGPVRTAFGYSIIRVDDRFVKPVLTESEYATRKKRLHAYVLQRKQETARRDLHRQVLDDLSVRIHEDIVSVLYAELSGLAAQVGESTGVTGTSVVASTSRRDVTVQEFLREASFSTESTLSAVDSIEDLEAFIRGVAVRTELVDRARQAGVEETQAFQTANRNALDDWLYLRAWELWMSSIYVDEDETRRYYEDNLDDFIDVERRHLWEIATRSAETAQMLADTLTAGNFRVAAILHSEIPGADEAKGYAGAKTRAELGGAANAVFDANNDTVVGPVRRGNFYVLILTGDKIPSGYASYENARASIEELLRQKKLTEMVNRDVEQLRTSVDVKINFDVLYNFNLTG